MDIDQEEKGVINKDLSGIYEENIETEDELCLYGSMKEMCKSGIIKKTKIQMGSQVVRTKTIENRVNYLKYIIKLTMNTKFQIIVQQKIFNNSVFYVVCNFIEDKERMFYLPSCLSNVVKSFPDLKEVLIHKSVLDVLQEMQHYN